MRIAWRQRLEQQPGLQTVKHWPVIPLASLPRASQAGFLRNQRIVAQVLNNDTYKEIARQHNISIGRISQLMDRCLGGNDDESPALTMALIPNQSVTNNRRLLQLPSLQKQRGNACAFKALLETVPQLRERLDEMIRAKLKDNVTAQRLTPQTFHGTFKCLLGEAHWPSDQYPYTSKSLAYQSVRRYLHRRTDELRLERIQKQVSPVRNLGVPAKRYRALRAIQIDEHIIDLNSRLNIVLNDELIPLRLARANVLVATDVDTTCVLGYHLAPTEHPNQQDMLTVLDNCIQPWHPLELTTPGLDYAPGATFPAGLADACPMSFGTVQLDNALMHRAQSVIDLLCEQFGATLSWGLPGMPKTRQLVESVFDYINRIFSHRVASTTGSYPTDPNKESRKNQKKPPVITFQMVNEALSVILSEYNVSPVASLGNSSPLELYQHHCANHFIRFVPRTLSDQWQPLIRSKELFVHWYKPENRQPFVNFFYERYYGPGLTRVLDKGKAVGQRVRVQFSHRDIRTLKAFSLDGEDLGEINVSSPWQRFPHSLATRQKIHQHAKSHRLNTRDPLAGYFQYLLKHKEKPAIALSLLSIYNEFTSGYTNSLSLGLMDQPLESTSPLPTRQSRHTWQSSSANHRE